MDPSVGPTGGALLKAPCTAQTLLLMWVRPCILPRRRLVPAATSNPCPQGKEKAVVGQRAHVHHDGLRTLLSGVPGAYSARRSACERPVCACAWAGARSI